MFSLRDVLRKRFPNNPHVKNILVACGVVFPDIHFTSFSQEIIPEIIYDAETENITEYMDRIFDYWQEKQHREPGRLSLADIRDIVDSLRGDFVFIPSLSSRLNHAEKHLLRLTSEQAQMEDIVFFSPNRYEYSLLSQTDIVVNVLGSSREKKKDMPEYAAIQSFKGLDSKIVIFLHGKYTG